MEEQESVLENYSCAANCGILLQGMLYVTQLNVYFYSPFNKKTVIGHGTKIKISYESLSQIRKHSHLLIFPNSIRFELKSGEDITFTSFVSRDTCFSLILMQLTNANHTLDATNSLQNSSVKEAETNKI